MIPYTKIEATPLNERISTLLKDAIIEGQFKPGEEIGLTAIAERYGVSRTPVREAFQHLAKDGFLQLRMNKSAIVVGIDTGPDRGAELTPPIKRGAPGRISDPTT